MKTQKLNKLHTALFLLVVLLILAMLKISTVTREMNYWKSEFVSLENSCNRKLNCVNTGTILSPQETKESLTELVKRVRNNCF